MVCQKHEDFNGTGFYSIGRRIAVQIRKLAPAIDALSNKNPFEPWINVTAEAFKVYPEDGLTNAETGAKMEWTTITSHGKTETFGNPQMANARVATAADFGN